MMLRIPFAALIAFLFAGLMSAPLAQQPARAVAIDDDDIGGVVTSAKGPEAGVWVIAETTGLGTKFRKIVVTDDAGRYVVPDLPRGNYTLWVRGYGLTDSKPVPGRPGQQVNLQATIAATPQDAAAVYPANYWYSMIKVPDKSEFPGTGEKGNGISPNMRSQADWISQLKDGCQLCHQMGNRATREFMKPIPNAHSTRGVVGSRACKSGQRGPQMSRALDQFGRRRAIEMFADWTDRINKGEVPPAPPRPQGARAQPRAHAVGLGRRALLHPRRGRGRQAQPDDRRARQGLWRRLHRATRCSGSIRSSTRPGSIPIPVLQPGAAVVHPREDHGCRRRTGARKSIFNNPVHPHNPMMDQRQRVWTTAAVRPSPNPEYCKRRRRQRLRQELSDGSRAAGRRRSTTRGRRRRRRSTPAIATHHLQFAEDKDNTLYFSGDTNVIGWINTRIWDETGDAAKAQGWCPLVVDTNGDGKIGAYTQPNEKPDPTRDMRVAGFAYGIIVNPTDGSIW